MMIIGKLVHCLLLLTVYPVYDRLTSELWPVKSRGINSEVRSDTLCTVDRGNHVSESISSERTNKPWSWWQRWKMKCVDSCVCLKEKTCAFLLSHAGTEVPHITTEFKSWTMASHCTSRPTPGEKQCGITEASAPQLHCYCGKIQWVEPNAHRSAPAGYMLLALVLNVLLPSGYRKKM